MAAIETRHRLAARVLTLVFLAVCWPADTRAEDPDAAQRHFERAVRLHEERAYDAALAEFQRAHELSPRYQVLFNIGQVHYQLNEFADAQRAFERYLTEGGDEIGPERRAYVRRELAELRERVGTLTVLTDAPGASVLLDDAELGVTPLSPIAVDIGRHVLRVELPGHRPVTRKLNIVSGEQARVELELEAVSEQAATLEEEPAPTEPSQRRGALWTLGSASLALAVGAGASFAVAYRSDAELDRQLRTLPPDGAAIADTRDRVRRAALASDVLGAGALLLATGFVLTLVTRGRGDEPVTSRRENRRVATRIDVGVGTVGLHGAF